MFRRDMAASHVHAQPVATSQNAAGSYRRLPCKKGKYTRPFPRHYYVEIYVTLCVYSTYLTFLQTLGRSTACEQCVRSGSTHFAVDYDLQVIQQLWQGMVCLCDFVCCCCSCHASIGCSWSRWGPCSVTSEPHNWSVKISSRKSCLSTGPADVLRFLLKSQRNHGLALRSPSLVHHQHPQMEPPPALV